MPRSTPGDRRDWLVVSGASLRAGEAGLVASDGNRHLRILVSDSAEAVRWLAPHGVGPGTEGSESLERVIPLLRERSILAAVDLRADMLDLAGVRPLGKPFHFKRIRRLSERRLDVPLVVAGDAEDPALRSVAVELEPPFVAAWLTPRTAAVLVSTVETPGCLACALRFDGELAETALPDEWAQGRRVLSPHVRAISRLLIELALVSPGWSTAGPLVRWLDVELGGVRTEAVPADPACKRCASRPSLPDAEASWEAYEGRRFAPLRVLRPPAAALPHRVIYRGSASLDRVGRSAFGVAVAAGPKAAERALAEGMERFCFMRAPVQAFGSASELRGARLDDRSIEELLFPAAAYEQSGFRFARFDRTVELAWSTAQRLRDGAELLLPTDLVGHSGTGGARLADATTNGCAAHRDRRLALEHALLELVERDALLLAWLGGAELVAIHDHGTTAERLLLVGSDFDVPIVIAWSKDTTGRIRLGSAARSSLDDAIEAAVRELHVVIRASAPNGPRPDLEDARARNGPLQHVRHYDDASHAPALERFLTPHVRVRLEELRGLWSARATRAKSLASRLVESGLDPLVADIGRPELFGGWSVVRAVVPGLVELSWGRPYLRVASRRAQRALGWTDVTRALPHPFG